MDDDFGDINTPSANATSAATTSTPEASAKVITEQTKESIENESKPNEEDAYSVPIDVLQTISKNFEKLQENFEKTTATTPTESSVTATSENDVAGSTTDENRVIRIKSIRTVPPGKNWLFMLKEGQKQPFNKL